MMAFDAVFLSYDEPLADELYQRLCRVLGQPVKRLHRVSGMRRAYRLTAELVDTDEFFIADGDFEISDAFPAGQVSPLAAGVAMRVWQATNAVNGLTYGYGGLKLVRRSALRALGEAVDVLAALPGRVEFRRQIAGWTRFNASPFHTWRAGFRECAMLTRGCEYGTADATAASRLAVWQAGGTGAFAEWAARGARDGVAFARQAAGDQAVWELLNTPSALRARFESTYGPAGSLR